MSEYRYDISVYESCVGPNPLKVERQDPDNFTYFPTRKRCAWDLAAYVFKYFQSVSFNPSPARNDFCRLLLSSAPVLRQSILQRPNMNPDQTVAGLK